MTYDLTERSEQDGAPVELYQFARLTDVWRYTSAEADITFDGHTWTSMPVMRSSVQSSQELARNSLKVTVPRNLPVAELFRVTSPTEVLALTIRRYHRQDENAVAVWVGRVLNCEWQGAQAELNCEPVSTSLRRPGLRRLYQKQCPHVLYSASPGCGVDRDLHKIETTVAAIAGNELVVDALLDRPYAGGYVEWEPTPGILERRFIRDFVASELVLLLTLPFQGIAVNDPVTVYPGCDHTMATCDTVYSNVENYGGFPYIPTKNPFDGTPVY